MKRNISGKFTRFFVAAVVLCFTVLTVVANIPAPVAQPTILFQCMDFRLVEDGSIQALVQISAENMDYFAGTAFNVDFNPNYIRPSYLEEIGGAEKQTIIEAKTEGKRDYFNERELLAVTQTADGVQRSPFVQSIHDTTTNWNFSLVEPGNPAGQSSDRGQVGMYLVLNQNLVENIVAHPIIKETVLDPGIASPDNKRLYIAAQGEVDPGTGEDGYGGSAAHSGMGANLGTLSFWVNPENLTEMVQKFGEGTASGTDFLIGLPEAPNNPNDAKDDDWMISALVANPFSTFDELWSTEYTEDNPIGGYGEPGDPEAKFEFRFVFPKVLVKAFVAGGTEISLNAYQNYTTGTVDDLAETVQRYRPEITVGYADGSLENKIITWGKAADGYTVYRPALAGETPDYTDAANNEKWVKLGENYDPKGGTYLVSQYFKYEENGTAKTAPVPMRVKVTVDPVTLNGVNTTGKTETYTTTQTTADTFGMENLHLPKKALLSVTPVPGNVVLTMPINAWSPSDVTEMSAVGTYTFNSSDATRIKSYVNQNCKWVTVPDGFAGAVSVERKVVAENTAGLGDYTLDRYAVAHATTTGNGALNLKVTKRDAAGTGNEALASTVAFKLYLPGGLAVDTDSNGLPQVSTEPAGGTAYYYPINNGTAADGYTLSYYPGNAAATNPHREDVRRAINLGGWFYVSVQEDHTWGWSDLIPVYVPPRTNYYDKSYIGDDAFDYTGHRARLFPFYTDSNLPTDVVLPVGDSVGTTYDGATGAEPGSVGQFKVGQWAQGGYQTQQSGNQQSGNQQGPVGGTTGKLWAADTMVLYGQDAFATARGYDGAGVITNDNTDPKLVTLKTVPMDATVGVQPVEELSLTYADGSDTGILRHADGQVALVEYQVQTQGYVSRQNYTLTLENTGSTDIYGISLDVDNGAHSPDGASHFEIVRQPSAYLEPGGKTTFTVTYVLNLEVQGAGTSTTYQDTLRISANSGALLKAFDARFKVSNLPIYQVTVALDPTDETMGTAGLIRGLAEGIPALPTDATEGDVISAPAGVANRPNLTAAGTAYESGYKYVWLLAETVDEYAVESVTYEDGGTSHDAYVYQYTADPAVDGDEDVTVYFFPMPDHDVTVTVKFYEPIYSKLRLQTLLAYSGLDSAVAGGTLINGADSDLNRKDVRWDSDTTKVIGNPMSPEDSSQSDFLVVLDRGNDDDTVKAQLSTTLRKGLPDPTPSDPSDQSDPREGIAPIKVEMVVEETSGSVHSDPDGSTLTPTTHTSTVFDAPAKGESVTVKMTLTYVLKTATPDYPLASTTAPVTVSRESRIKFVRQGDSTPHTMLYGNSPFGMIMNADNITDKNAAKDAFLLHDRFDGGYTPTQAAGKLTNTYWPEAWTGQDNLDRDHYAMFVLLGQDFTDPGIIDVRNSAGYPVAAADISRSVTVNLLDGTADTQAGRFAGQQTVPGTMDTVTLNLGTVDNPLVENWWHLPADPDTGAAEVDYLIRPGVYTMEYTFVDYDGSETLALKRPLIILPVVGDINADRALGVNPQDSTSDGELIQDRVTNPLGYNATGYAAANIFRYRVCDINNDRNMNNIDSNVIYYGINTIVPYYLPTGYAP